MYTTYNSHTRKSDQEREKDRDGETETGRDRVRQRHIQRKTETEFLKKHLSSVKKQSEWDLLWQKLSQVTALSLYTLSPRVTLKFIPFLLRIV